MKKLLLAAVLMIASVTAKAQATEIYYFNHNPTNLTLYLEDNRSCGTLIPVSGIFVPPVPPIPGYNRIVLGGGSAYPALVSFDPMYVSIVGVTAILHGAPYTVGEPTTTTCGTPTGFPYAIGGGGPETQYELSFQYPTFWSPNIVDLRDF
jgi:hypothetical protein